MNWLFRIVTRNWLESSLLAHQLILSKKMFGNFLLHLRLKVLYEKLFQEQLLFSIVCRIEAWNLILFAKRVEQMENQWTMFCFSVLLQDRYGRFLVFLFQKEVLMMVPSLPTSAISWLIGKNGKSCYKLQKKFHGCYSIYGKTEMLCCLKVLFSLVIRFTVKLLRKLIYGMLHRIWMEDASGLIGSLLLWKRLNGKLSQEMC